MISDYIDPKNTSPESIEYEIVFLEKIQQDISEYHIDYEYKEIRNSVELKNLLMDYDKQSTIVFNWVEDLDDVKDGYVESIQILESSKFIFTGGNLIINELCTDKFKTKLALIENEIRTPKYIYATGVVDLLSQKSNITYPSLIKIASEHSSIGLNSENLVHNENEALQVSKSLFETYQKPLLIEEYLPGIEYTVSVWGNQETIEMLPPLRIKYENAEVSQILTRNAKFELENPEYKNTEEYWDELSESSEMYKQIQELSLKTYIKLGIFDYARIDVREKENKFYVIDVNSNPMVEPESGLLLSAQKHGYNLGEAIIQICEFALLRNLK